VTVLLPSSETAWSMLYSLLGKGATFVISLELVLDIIYNVGMAWCVCEWSLCLWCRQGSVRDQWPTRNGKDRRWNEMRSSPDARPNRHVGRSCELRNLRIFNCIGLGGDEIEGAPPSFLHTKLIKNVVRSTHLQQPRSRYPFILEYFLSLLCLRRAKPRYMNLQSQHHLQISV